jgi:autotransporter-associated beta strand protein
MFGVAGNYTTTGILKLDGGVLGRNGTFSQSLGGSSTNVQWIASTSGGFAAYGTNATWGNAANNLAVNINNNAGTLTWGTTANFLSSGQALILGAAASNGTVDFQNGLNFGASNQTIQVDRGATAPAGGVDAKISGVIGSSGGGLTKTGLGTLQLTGNNSYTGATLISGGILELKNTSTTALSGTSGLTINNSGTLLFSANNQLNQTTPASISLGGGTGTPQINAGGVSQGTNATAGIGALTLSSNSTIDMTGNSLLHFGASTAAATGVLSILDWNGLVTGNSLTGGSSTDLLRFGTSNSNLSFISQIQFVDPNGVSGTFAAMFASGNPGEVVPDLATPVPEPSTWIGAALALLAVGLMTRKRFNRKAETLKA